MKGNNEVSKESIYTILDKVDLTENEYQVIIRRYGNQERLKTFKEISNELQISRQRAEKLEKQTLGKIKALGLGELFSIYTINPIKTWNTIKKISLKENKRKSFCNTDSENKVEVIRNHKKIATAIFNGKYSEEEIVAAISRLKENHQTIFYKKWSRDTLEEQTKGLMDKEISTYHHQVIKNLKQCLEDLEFVPWGCRNSYENRSKGPEIATIIFNDGYSVEEIVAAIDRLKESHQTIFYKLWTEDTLEKKNKVSILTSGETTTYYRSVIPNLQHCLDDPNYVPWGCRNNNKTLIKQKDK